MITIYAFRRVPDLAKGQVRDLRMRCRRPWATGPISTASGSPRAT